MAKLPDIQSARPTARPTRAIATISPSAAAAPARALQGIGEEVTRLGEVMFDRETTAIATERDTMVSDQIRDLIYNPETGFAAMKGNQAVGARQRTIEKLEALKATAFDGLNATAKRKLQSSLDRRISGAMDTVERHTLGERDNWLAGASAARVEAAYQDSLLNPADTSAALSVIENETRAQGIREGWGPERTQVELEAKRSKVFHDQAVRIASADPIAAMQFMRDNQDKMVASDVVKLESNLTPALNREIGRRAGLNAALSTGKIPEGFNWANHVTQGGTRADAISGLDQNMQVGLANLIQSAPPEIRAGLQVFSGYRSVEKQKELWQGALKKYGSAAEARKWVAPPGSSNHNHGKAADMMWNGQRLDKAPAHVREWVHANAATFGLHFPLSNEAWHVETMGTRGTKPFVPSATAAQDLLKISDPTQQDAAFSTFNRAVSVSNAIEAEQRDNLIDRASEHIFNGGDINDPGFLTPQEKVVIGVSGMSSLEAFQNRATPIKRTADTDAVFYDAMEEAENEPEVFLRRDLAELRATLPTQQYDTLRATRLNILNAKNTGAAKVAGERAKAVTEGVDVSSVNSATGFLFTKDDEDNVVKSVKTRVLDWANAELQRTGIKPTDSEMVTIARQMKMKVNIDASSMPFNAVDRIAGAIDFTGNTATKDDDVSPQDFAVALANKGLTIGGVVVPPEVAKQIVADMTKALGREPTPDEILFALTRWAL